MICCSSGRHVRFSFMRQDACKGPQLDTAAHIGMLVRAANNKCQQSSESVR